MGILFLMHADICDPDDEKAVARFKATLASLGASILDKTWAIGVDAFKVEIDDEVVTVFSDAWSIDIEGPNAIVERILHAFHEQSATET